MLALRLSRGSHPLVLLRRLLVAAASAGVGFLLLCTLSYAVSGPHPADPAAQRLAWCLAPLAATVQFAVAVARTDPGTRPRQGLSAVGLGPVRMSALAAASTAVSGALGSAVALLLFLHLRGDLSGTPFDGDAAELLAAGEALPLGAVFLLLALVPVLGAGAAALALRPPRRRTGELPGDEPEHTTGAPGGLPWGVALTAVGVAVEAYTARGAGSTGGAPGGVLAGWTLTAVGLATAGPGIVHLCGRVLQSVRPGAMRLLAGRALMDDARRIGRPLGVVCAVVSALIAASALAGERPQPFGPLTALGAVLVAACTVAALLTSAVEARQARAATRAGLLELGASASLLQATALLRAVVLLAVFAPLTWAVGELAALPLRR
ncbi:hypothetical protein HHX38_22120 [Streptomyces sp. PKU-MA01144]|uniref:hypothetical protein n=1 Tax=Streptomyces sp. PKU-MA01144 TaxID=2729138 RepID=UPI001481B2C4|nr:hypothetical protein [Streptomyces sp. PKU-MA01144]NNJ06806.1 hypothetical protein [Streptomyces sp. PKU-MA01144]